MILHVFNPEHDISLASGLKSFTPPAAVRLLREGAGFLPALWARRGDAVLVGDVERASREAERVSRMYGITVSNCRFVTYRDLHELNLRGVDVWGWDRAIVARLARHGVPRRLMPDDDRLTAIRRLSSRATAARLLPLLAGRGRAGEAFVCQGEDEIRRHIAERGAVVLKSPWSCSGRGVRFVRGGEVAEQLSGWIRKTLKTQGAVMVEPYYKKVMDFGMEFFCHGDGSVEYAGLSLFSVTNGAYTGNVIAPEAYKRERISAFVPAELLNDVKEKITDWAGTEYRGVYEGPFGVDMMVVEGTAGGDPLLHPCVEINLRRTMGHVALAVRTDCDGAAPAVATMGIDNYKFIMKTL